MTEQTQRVNGKSRWYDSTKVIFALFGIIISLGGLLYAQAMGRVASVEARQERTSERTVATERDVKNLYEDIQEIKQDVKSLLKR